MLLLLFCFDFYISISKKRNKDIHLKAQITVTILDIISLLETN